VSFDPRTFATQRQFPRPTSTYVTNRVSGKLAPLHTHWARLDEKGSGTTDIRAGHYHRIIDGRLLPSPVDSHEHIMTLIPGGVG
jgi:hypothetical protein